MIMLFFKGLAHLDSSNTQRNRTEAWRVEGQTRCSLQESPKQERHSLDLLLIVMFSGELLRIWRRVSAFRDLALPVRDGVGLQMRA